MCNTTDDILLLPPPHPNLCKLQVMSAHSVFHWYSSTCGTMSHNAGQWKQHMRLCKERWFLWASLYSCWTILAYYFVYFPSYSMMEASAIVKHTFSNVFMVVYFPTYSMMEASAIVKHAFYNEVMVWSYRDIYQPNSLCSQEVATWVYHHWLLKPI